MALGMESSTMYQCHTVPAQQPADHAPIFIAADINQHGDLDRLSQDVLPLCF